MPNPPANHPEVFCSSRGNRKTSWLAGYTLLSTLHWSGCAQIILVTCHAGHTKMRWAPPKRPLHLGSKFAGTAKSERKPGENLGAFLRHSLQATGIKFQCLQDRGCNLSGRDGAGNRRAGEPGVRHQQNNLGVVMAKSAMLRLLLLAVRVGHADIGCHNDIRRTRVPVWWQTWRVVIKGQRGPRENYADASNIFRQRQGGRGCFQFRYGGRCV
jgi:hypothetical protein